MESVALRETTTSVKCRRLTDILRPQTAFSLHHPVTVISDSVSMHGSVTCANYIDARKSVIH